MNRFLISTLALFAGSVFAQGPARHDIVADCPAIADQLPEQLASAMNELNIEGTVRVQLVVDADGLRRIEAIDGPRRYHGRVRSALLGLDCRTPAPQRYVLNIHFGEPTATTRFAAASAPH